MMPLWRIGERSRLKSAEETSVDSVPNGGPFSMTCVVICFPALYCFVNL
jgi:hypothetical protein